MATAENIRVDGDDSRVVIDHLEVSDEELVEFLTEFDGNERDDALVRVLRVGATALNLSETAQDVEFVERKFQELEQTFDEQLSDFEEELDDTFGDDGKVRQLMDRHFGDEGKLDGHFDRAFGENGEFAQRLKDELGEDGEKIQEALDPDREGTPTYRLKRSVMDEIETVKEKFDRESGREEIRQESRHKGFEFEDRIEEILSDIVAQTSNSYEHTAESTGHLGESKKGDFVVTLGDTDQRIAIEAKNGQFNGTVEDEMEKVLENRQADFGIFVAESIEYLPRTRVGWFSEKDQNYVVVALSGEDEEEIEPRFLKFAFHWARTRAVLSYVDVGDEIDTETIKAELDGIEDAIGEFSQIRSHCTSLEKSVHDIRESLGELEDEINERLSRLRRELGKDGD